MSSKVSPRSLLPTSTLSPVAASSAAGVGAHGVSAEDLAVYDMCRALGLCHNVTPTTDDQTGEVVFQAASPDEVCVVWAQKIPRKSVCNCTSNQ